MVDYFDGDFAGLRRVEGAAGGVEGGPGGLADFCPTTSVPIRVEKSSVYGNARMLHLVGISQAFSMERLP